MTQTGDTSRNSPNSDPSPSLRWRLDRTPTFEEEVRDWPDEARFSGATYDRERAKLRIDSLARGLAVIWSLFLAYLILAQGAHSGLQIVLIPFTERGINVVPFALKSSEFIAVVTTTTVSVFGFLVIVAKDLFRKD